jgi:hypothetical protein
LLRGRRSDVAIPFSPHLAPPPSPSGAPLSTPPIRSRCSLGHACIYCPYSARPNLIRLRLSRTVARDHQNGNEQ